MNVDVGSRVGLVGVGVELGVSLGETRFVNVLHAKDVASKSEITITSWNLVFIGY